MDFVTIAAAQQAAAGEAGITFLDANFLADTYFIDDTASTFATVVSFSRSGDAQYVNASNEIDEIGSGNPRLGHKVYNGSSWSEAGLLIETAALTNGFDRTEELNSTASWTRDSLSGVNFNFTAGPDGGTTMDKLQEDSTNSDHYLYQLLSAYTGTWVFSGWIDQANNSNRFLQLRPFGVGANKAWATFNPITGALTQSGGTDLIRTFTQDWGDGRYRVGIVADTTIVNSSDGMSFVLSNSGTGGEIPSYNGTSGTGVSVWGAQWHEGDQPQFYAPTIAAISTPRNAESISLPSANLPYNASGMSGAFDRKLTYFDTGQTVQQTLFDWRADANNRITVTLNTSSTLTGRLDLTVVNGGTSLTKSTTVQITDGFDVDCKFAWRVTPAEVNVSLNGTTATAATNTAGVPDLSASDAVLGDFFVSARERVWGSDIGDAGLGTATA